MTKHGSNRLLAVRARAKREGWLDRIKSETDERAAVEDGAYFDKRRAAHAVAFGPRYLCLTGAYQGRPFHLADWAAEQVVEPLFGWVRPDPDWGRPVRRFRYFFGGLPKKNGKSPLGSYIALYCLAGDGPNTRGCEAYCASTDKNQAAIVHGAACAMVEASPKLSRFLDVRRSRGSIAWKSRNSWLRVLSSSPKRNEGWNAQLVVADELHKWHGRDLWDALRWAFASRPEPLLFAITTAGDDEHSVCFEQWERARRVASGEQYDPQMLAVLYEAGEDDDPHAESTWRSANPALGSYLPLRQFRHDHDEAWRAGGAAWRRWLQLRLNLWPGAAGGWIEKIWWTACAQSEPPLAAALEGRPCAAAIDLGLVHDLSSLALAFPSIEPGGPSPLQDEGQERAALAAWDGLTVSVLCHSWIPRAVVLNEPELPWLEWEAKGSLTITDDDEADFAAVLERLGRWTRRYAIQSCRYDPMFAAFLMQEAERVYAIRRVEYAQTMMNYAQPCKLWERFARRGQLRHDGDPVLAWCVRNTSVKCDDNDNMRPIKPKRGSPKRIDAAVAAIMAFAGALEAPPHRVPTHYDRHPPRFSRG